MSDQAGDLAGRMHRLETAFQRLEHERFYDQLAGLIGDGAETQELSLAPRFVESTSDGWLVTKINGARVSLPSAIKVDLRSTSGGRDYGKVLEGVLSGADFDVFSGHLVSSYDHYKDLVVKVTKSANGPVEEGGVSYDLTLSLTYCANDKSRTAGPFAAMIETGNSLAKGWHDIEIPDFPHLLGSGYGDFGTTWFRIGHKGARYMHPGQVSEGCLTCAPSGWNEIYSIVHRCRHTDSLSVGRLNVI